MCSRLPFGAHLFDEAFSHQKDADKKKTSILTAALYKRIAVFISIFQPTSDELQSKGNAWRDAETLLYSVIVSLWL